MAKIFARLIHKKIKHFTDIPEKWAERVKKAFKELYYIDVEAWEEWAYADNK